MKRLKLIFAAFILLLALPCWRFIDFVAITSPFEIFYTISMLSWGAIFISIPVKLLVPKLKPIFLGLIVLTIGLLSYFATPLSRMGTLHPELNHCGRLTFTGVFYPVRSILTDAYYDDLEARNQMCWVRKMISRVPEFADVIEIQNYTKLVENKLMLPEIKYRVSLPLIAALFVKINSDFAEYQSGKKIYDSLHFWVDHYTYEISTKEYPSWNWPHSAYIKYEYALIEENWQDLIESIEVL